VIDPTLAYATYLGGNSGDMGMALAVDDAGNAYVTGMTSSTDFPTAHAFQPIGHATPSAPDAFVAQLAPDGGSLVFATYLGGTGTDQANGIAVDPAGNVVVTGTTQSADFPTRNAIDATLSGTTDAFVTELAAGGAALVYSTLLGGSSVDFGDAVAVDGAGTAYVAGGTQSADFPLKNPLRRFSGASDVFLAKLAPQGASLVYSTCLGGTGSEDPGGIALDSAGDVYVAGQTDSSDFPTARALYAAKSGTIGGMDAFVSELAPDGASLVFSTYFGGAGDEGVAGIGVDQDGRAYVTGATSSTDLPTRNPFEPSKTGFTNAFVAAFAPSGTSLEYATYLGGTNYEQGHAIAVDRTGNAYVTGETFSTDFPTKDAIQPALDQPDAGDAGGFANDAFITKLDPTGSALVFSTYFGGSRTEMGMGVRLDGTGTAFVAGFTTSADLPTRNALYPRAPGGYDVFILSLADAGSGRVEPSDASIPAAGGDDAGVDATGPGATGPAGGASSEGGGCGCRCASPSSPRGATWLVLFAGALVRRKASKRHGRDSLHVR
jgi:hypothetical protein